MGAHLALMVLGKLGETDAVPLLQAMLEDPQTRPHGLTPLTTFDRVGPAAAPLLPALRQVLREKHESYIIEAAARVAGAIGPEAAAAAPELVTLLEDPSEWVRQPAARALGRIGPDAQAALPMLTARLDDPDAQVIASAALALWQIDRDQYEPAQNALLDLFRKFRWLRGHWGRGHWAKIDAAEALAVITPPVHEAVPVLQSAFSAGTMPPQVARALWRIEGRADAVLPALMANLKRTPDGLAALRCLEEMGPQAAPAAAALREAVATDRVVNDFNDMGQVIELDEQFRALVDRVLIRIG